MASEALTVRRCAPVHELGLCAAVAEAVLRRAGDRRVRAVRVRIGGHPVDPEVINQGFALAAAGTVAEHAAVDVVMEPMSVHCRSCGHTAPSDDPLATYACPGCGGLDIEVTGEDRVVLESITVDAPEHGSQSWTPSSC